MHTKPLYFGTHRKSKFKFFRIFGTKEFIVLLTLNLTGKTFKQPLLDVTLLDMCVLQMLQHR